jgi:hypothetical protein
MATYRVAIGFPMDSVLPRDIVTINPHYEGDNPQALADAIKVNLKADSALGTNLPFTIKVYDAKKAPPSYPLYTTTNGTGFATSTGPREVALCLSYYATWNRPQFRGRLFIPATFVGSGLALRPTDTQLANCLRWGNIVGKNLPSNHFWVVYSRKAGTSAQVNQLWVDDEWDTMRSRGLRNTKRTTAPLP